MDYRAMLGERIRQERKKLNLTQERLSEKVGLSTAYMGQIERGERSLNLDKLIAVAKVLGVTVDYLLADSVPEQIQNSADIWLQLTQGRSPEEIALAVNMIKMIFAYLEERPRSFGGKNDKTL